MLQLPSAPTTPNERALGQVYREEFTGLTVATVTLSYTPMRTVNNVGIEQVYKNGKLLALHAETTTGASTTVQYRETRTGSTSAAWTLGHTPDSGLELLFKNGAALTPTTDYTISGATVTLGSAPVSGDKLLARYATTTAATPSSLGTSYTIDGKTITLDETLIAADVVVVIYAYRA